MYKLKNIILKGVIGAMGIAGVTVCALAFIPGSLDGSKHHEDTNLDVDTEIDTSAFAESIQDGQILQCFCWSYNEIIEKLPKIASQGFTAIQTSPVQVSKDGTSGGKLAKDYWDTFYAPGGFKVDDSGTSALGTPDQFREMVVQAHSLGIKVIVDVVANHMGNQFTSDSLCERAYYYEWEIAGMSAKANSEAMEGENGYVPYTGEVWSKTGGKTTPGATDATAIPVIDTYYYKDTLQFHPYLEESGNDAYNITQANLGMMDLNTGSTIVQNAVSEYLEELIGYGVDGFRFDSAKNIETQYDDEKSDFWPVVMKAAKIAMMRQNKDLFTYGEIDGDLGDNRDLGWYTANGIGITDSSLGTNITLNDGAGFSSFRKSKKNNYQDYRNKMVVWAESHKDYTSSTGTRDKSEAVINKSYAILAARKDMASLYCARFNDYDNATLGQASALNGWSYPEIGAVNKFHNFYSKEDADEKCYMDGNYTVIERFIDSYSANNGIVIVGNSGSVSVKTSHLADGSYVDQVSGNTFTVGGGKIFGTMGDTGIAVIYSASDTKSPSIKASMNSGIIHEDYLSVTYTFKNAVASTVDVGGHISSTATEALVRLENIEEGTTITVNIKLDGVDGSTLNKTYTYTRYKSLGLVELYFNNSLNWDRVFAYAWNDSSLDSNDNWPGEELTEIVLDADQNECYTYAFDSDKYNYVAFSNGEGDKTEDIIVTGSYEYTLGDIIDGSYSVQTSEFEEYDDPLKDVITVYYKNDSNWANCYAYTWKTGTLHSNETWPGEKIEAVGREIDGYIAYSVDVDLSIFDMIIFNNGENKNNDKTPDISLDYESTGFTYDGSSYVFKEYDGSVPAIDPDPVVVETNIITVDFKNDLGWANAYVYLWNNENDNVYSEWPGTLMTSLGKDIDNCDAFSFDVDLNLYDMISFTNGEEEPEFTDDFALTDTTKGYTSEGNSYDFIAYGTELPEGNVITVYYRNDKNWSSVNAYMWNSETNASNADWPGEAITYVGLDADGLPAYSLEVDYTAYDYIIFNDGSGNQTGNLSITIATKGFTSDGSDYTYTAFSGDPDATEVTVYFKNSKGWESVSAYMWKDGTGTNNGWPGVEVSKVGTDGEYDVYSLVVDIITYNRIIFNNGTGGEGYQTQDLFVTVATTGYDADGTKYTYSTE